MVSALWRIVSRRKMQCNGEPTFRDGQEAYHDDGVPVCTVHIIVNIANRSIQWIIFILASCDRYGGLVAPKYNRNEHRPVVPLVLGDDILE